MTDDLILFFVIAFAAIVAPIYTLFDIALQ